VSLVYAKRGVMQGWRGHHSDTGRWSRLSAGRRSSSYLATSRSRWSHEGLHCSVISYRTDGWRPSSTQLTAARASRSSRRGRKPGRPGGPQFEYDRNHQIRSFGSFSGVDGDCCSCWSVHLSLRTDDKQISVLGSSPSSSSRDGRQSSVHLPLQPSLICLPASLSGRRRLS